MFIEKEVYEKILDIMPITCIDMVIRNNNYEILLLKRSNEPAKGEYWLPGGRLFKNESIEDCIRRKLKEEIYAELEEYEFLGFTNTEFNTGPFGKPVHTLNLTFSVKIKNENIIVDDNHESFIWASDLPSNLNKEIKRILIQFKNKFPKNHNKKLWASEEIFLHLGYNNLDSEPHLQSEHQKFVKWIDKNFDRKINIVDVGGGNGNLINYIDSRIKKYINLDLNEFNINTGAEFYKHKKNCQFKLFDIEKDDISFLEKVDVFYFDSTFTMLEKPLDCLMKIRDKCDYIFLNRTPLYEETNQVMYNWTVPNVPQSYLWKFSWEYLERYCNYLKMKIYQNDDKNEDGMYQTLFIKTSI